MTSHPRPLSTDRTSGVVDWLFRTETGAVVLGERPNARLKVGIALRAVAALLRGTGATTRGSGADLTLDRAGTVTLGWWATDEIVRGATRFRRAFGGLALAIIVWHGVAAERRRRASAQSSGLDPRRSGYGEPGHAGAVPGAHGEEGAAMPVSFPWSRRKSARPAPDAGPTTPGNDGNHTGAAVERAHAPAPDDPRKPTSPTQISKPSWKYILRRTTREFSADGATDMAAALTYYAVLAVAPALIAVFSALSLIGQSDEAVEGMLDIAAELGPPDAVETVEPIIEQITANPGAGLGLVLGLLGALWSASGYVGAFSRAMNRIYEIDEGRPVWKLRPAMLVVTVLALGLLALVAVGIVLTGPVAHAVGSVIGLGAQSVTVWNVVKWPVVLALVVVVVAMLYYATPNVRQPKFRWISVGAAVAIGVWVLGSAAFGFYVSGFTDYDATYGSLAGVIVFLLWLWLTNLALLFGAELDAELERGRQLQAGIAAEEHIQLPPRDTRASQKRATKAAQDVAEGRLLRDNAAHAQEAAAEQQATRGKQTKREKQAASRR